MREVFRSVFVMLVFLAGVHSALAQPTLSIAPAGNESVLYWATTSTNYILQATTNLNSPNWLIATDAMTVTAATVPNTLPVRIFRLFSTNPPAGMVLIPAGCFTMGDTLDHEIDASPTNIYVSAFYMDTNLVAYGYWQTVYAYATTNGYSFVHPGAGKGTNYPVETVDWYDCVKWCNARSQLAGLMPVYYTDAAFTQLYTNGEMTNIYANWTANGFRLPTEAEWEKAARGGLSGRRFPWGNRIDENQANYFGYTSAYAYDFGPDGPNPIGDNGVDNGDYPYTSPVGSFDANGYGLYDMAGNVSQWCWDWVGEPYGKPTPYNPTGPATGRDKMMRGGDWTLEAYYARCACHFLYYTTLPFFAQNNFGFRCVSGL